jgi:hypothetical protein
MLFAIGTTSSIVTATLGGQVALKKFIPVRWWVHMSAGVVLLLLAAE